MLPPGACAATAPQGVARRPGMASRRRDSTRPIRRGRKRAPAPGSPCWMRKASEEQISGVERKEGVLRVGVTQPRPLSVFWILFRKRPESPALEGATRRGALRPESCLPHHSRLSLDPGYQPAPPVASGERAVRSRPEKAKTSIDLLYGAGVNSGKATPLAESVWALPAMERRSRVPAPPGCGVGNPPGRPRADGFGNHCSEASLPRCSLSTFSG